MAFEVGKKYRTRGGDIVTLTEKLPDGGYLIGSMEGASYPWTFRAVDGRINNGPPDSQYDLMHGEVE